MLIDEENPRLAQPNAGQYEALRGLWQSDPEKLLELAIDISAQGCLDPTSRLIVMKHEENGRTSYRVLEGNRRIAAIKALESPDLLTGVLSPSAMKALRARSQEFQREPIVEIDCIVVDKREEADHWITLRHAKDQGGKATITWGADEKDRYMLRAGKIARPALHTQILNLLQDHGRLTDEDRRKVRTTTLERMIDDPNIRAKLAIESDGGDLRLLAPTKKVVAALTSLVRALIDEKYKVTDVYTKEDREEFAKRLPPSMVVKPTRKPGHGTSVAPSTPAGKVPTKKSKPKITPRDYLIPNDCKPNTSGRVQEIEDELRTLSLRRYANAVSVLLRVFVELTVDDYLEKVKFPGIDDHTKLGRKLDVATKDLLAKNKLTKAQAKAMSRCIAADHALAPSVNLMHAYVHNANMHVSAQDLRASWNNLQPFLLACWSP